MSLLGFLILYGAGIKITGTAWIVLSILYVGDCILMKGK